MVYFIVLFTVLPALELVVLIKVGGVIGAWNTVLIILLTGILGAYLARLQGFIVLRRIQDQLARGRLPDAELLDGLMILIGGIVLLTPGFITDIFGFVLLIPWTRNLIKGMIRHRFESMIREGRMVHWSSLEDGVTRDYDDIDI